MNDKDRIREQIKRMRSKCVEPEYIYVCPELYKQLGKPRYLCGIPIDCDSRLTSGFEVR